MKTSSLLNTFGLLDVRSHVAELRLDDITGHGYDPNPKLSPSTISDWADASGVVPCGVSFVIPRRQRFAVR